MKARNNLPESTGLVEKNKRLGSGREMSFDEIVAELPKQDLRDICDFISRDNPPPRSGCVCQRIRTGHSWFGFRT
jgi:hypothetical protein